MPCLEESDWTSLLIVRTLRMDHLLDPIVRDLVRCERIPSLADVTQSSQLDFEILFPEVRNRKGTESSLCHLLSLVTSLHIAFVALLSLFLTLCSVFISCNRCLSLRHYEAGKE